MRSGVVYDAADTLRQFEKMLVEPPGPKRDRLREQIVVGHRWIAQQAARRFADRGEPLDDLIQVGSIGLVKAVERFDPAVGTNFVSFAMPTVVGEIRRHFRDHTWSVRVPRRAKDLRPSVTAAIEHLTGELGRSPRVAEIAAHLEIDEELVLEAVEAGNAYRAQSIDIPNDASGGPSAQLQAALATNDADLAGVVDRSTVARLLGTLAGRERRIVYLRFFEQMSQAEIAEIIGTSQVHVGRLLNASLQRLRAELEDV